MTTLAFIEVVGNIGEVYLGKSNGPGAKPFLRLNVAVDDRVNGEKKTVWYKCIILSKAVETPEKLLKVFTVGRKVFARGKPRFSTFTRADGTQETEIAILVDGLPTVLDAKKPEN